MRLSQRNDPAQALSANRADEAFDEDIEVRATPWELHRLGVTQPVPAGVPVAILKNLP